MKCYICSTSFSYVSFGASAEPCDCGMELTRAEYEDMAENAPDRASQFRELKRTWNPRTGDFVKVAGACAPQEQP